MIDIKQLRKLGTDPVYAPPATLANACNDAADTIEGLCKQIDGTVRVANQALSERDALRAVLKPLAKIAEDERSRMPDIASFESILVAYHLLRDAAKALNDGPSKQG